MPDPLVAPDVVRFTVHQSYNGRNVANVIDLVVKDLDSGIANRQEAIRSATGDVLDAWSQYIRPFQSDSLICERVSFVDLGSEEGVTGERTSTADTTWPLPGAVTGQALPANVAILVTKETARRRGSRSGRMYVAGLVEAACDGSYITAEFFGNFVEACGDFTEALTETGNIATYEVFPTVVHTRNTGTVANPVIEYVDNTQITSFAPQRLVATQRRRLRG